MTERPAPKTMREGGIRVLVCGGRDFSDVDTIHRTLDRLHKARLIDCVIEGNARGADRIAGYWARKNRIDNRKFNADWTKYGNAAGPIRNQTMIDKGLPDVVLAFPGNTGTADMVRRARAAGIEVIEVAPKTMRRPAEAP